MKGYKLTLEQANSLIGVEYKQGCLFNPVADINGDYFIFQTEVNECETPELQWVKELQIEDYKTI